MTQSEAIKYAIDYLYNESCYKDHELCKYEHGGTNIILGNKERYKLHGSLQYRLCVAYQRMEANFGSGEINRKDIAHIVEAWAVSHSNERPLE